MKLIIGKIGKNSRVSMSLLFIKFMWKVSNAFSISL